MIIILTGPHSSGKTTLINNMKEDPFFHGATFITNIARDVQNILGLPINEHGDDITQIAIMQKHLENIYKYNNWVGEEDMNKTAIFDRFIGDVAMYTLWLHSKGKVDDRIKCAIVSMFNWQLSNIQYDFMFYTEPLKLVDDGQRSTDRDFYEGIVDNYEKYIKNECHAILLGDPQQRIQQIKDIIL